MIIELVKLGEKATDFEVEIKPDEVDLETEFANLKDSLSFKGKIRNNGARVEIEGEIFADVELNCNRCLSRIPKKLEFEFENVFITPENYTEEEEIEIEVKNLDVSIFQGDEIDLKEIAREQILLALPSQVLCKDDCKGLCKECGANLNLKSCKCEEKKVDPRWSALKDLKIDSK